MPDPPPLRLHSAEGRWAIAAAVIGSGIVFIESTVVNVALPAIGRDMSLGVSGLQWIVNGYLITLSALLLLGGALGDALGQKRVFEAGLLSFAAGSLLCAVAPNFPLLIVARLVQGAAGALLVPTSLAFLDTAFAEEDGSEAIGLWAGWSAVSTAVGPLLGGALVDFASWRWVFAAVIPLPLVAVWISRARIASPARRARPRVDFAGALLISGGLGALVWALIEGPERGVSPATLGTAALGLALVMAFIRVEARRRSPLLPLSMFRSRQFSGANATTLLVYAALGALFFFLMVQLQGVLEYSALAAGASLLPINFLMLVLSPRAGRWGARQGARVPITLGALLAAGGLALFARVGPGADYLTTILPATVVFGSGLGVLVAPLTAAVLSVAEEGRIGIASAVNNATARVAGLLAVALIPLVTGIAGLDDFTGPAFAAAFVQAMWICAALCVLGGVVAWLTVTERSSVAARPHPSPTHGCAQRRREGELARARPASAATGFSHR
jgi:EmrB/QacA subfamily drug resistance transporter